MARFELEEKTLFYFVDFDTAQSKSDDVQQAIPSKEDGKSLCFSLAKKLRKYYCNEFSPLTNTLPVSTLKLDLHMFQFGMLKLKRLTIL